MLVLILLCFYHIITDATEFKTFLYNDIIKAQKSKIKAAEDLKVKLRAERTGYGQGEEKLF